MKRIISACLGLALLVSVLWAGSVQAIQARSGERTEVTRNEVIDSSVYLAGSKVTVDGTVKGDLFCAGQEVTITGTVEGDVLCAGQNIRISGTVEGDVRLASQFALVSGKIDGSASVFSQTVTFEDKAFIGKDLTAFGQTATVSGLVNRDALVGGEVLLLGAKVQRNVQLLSEDIVLRNATIGGDLVYVGHNQAKIEQNSTITGKTEQQDPPAKHQNEQKKSEMFFAGPIFWLGSFLLTGIVLLAGLARFSEKQSVESIKKPFFTLGLGLLVFIMTPVLAGFSMVTIVGLPLSLVLLALWLSALVVSVPLASYTLGHFITQKMGWTVRGLRYISLFVGLLIVMLLSVVPILGGCVIFTAILWGMGSIVLGLRAVPHESKRKAITKA